MQKINIKNQLEEILELEDNNYNLDSYVKEKLNNKKNDEDTNHIIQQLKENLTKLEDNYNKLSFLLNEIKTVIKI